MSSERLMPSTGVPITARMQIGLLYEARHTKHYVEVRSRWREWTILGALLDLSTFDHISLCCTCLVDIAP